jgi:ABC-type transport system involved in multi-copper enzyme maturation permease subunit
VLSGAKEQQWPVVSYLQGFWLQWTMLGIVVGLVLLGSLVFSAPSANATICFIIVLGILLVGRHLNAVALKAGQPMQTVIYSIYFLIPHLEWYDIRDLLVYQQPGVPWIDCLIATLYAAVYTALLLVASWVIFRRKELTV